VEGVRKRERDFFCRETGVLNLYFIGVKQGDFIGNQQRTGDNATDKINKIRERREGLA
jgi:hypothetical protein